MELIDHREMCVVYLEQARINCLAARLLTENVTMRGRCDELGNFRALSVRRFLFFPIDLQGMSIPDEILDELIII